MANIGPQVSKGVREKVIRKCWDYLDRHFDNLNEANKLKVILTICPKNIPTELEGSVDLKTYLINYGDIKSAKE